MSAAVLYADPDIEFDAVLSSSSLSVDHGHQVPVARLFTPGLSAVSPAPDDTLPYVRLNSHAVLSRAACFLHTTNSQMLQL